ncbi:MAG: ABC transporter permease [Thermodesulfobacteriota bacterium]
MKAWGAWPTILGLAIKNLGRARARTWTTILAMALAGGVMIFYASLLNGWLAAMERNAVSMELGEFQLSAPGYRDDPDLYTIIPQPEQTLAHLRAAGFAAAPRLYASGLAAAGSSSAGVQLRGVDLTGEPEVTLLHRHVMTGAWLAEDDPDGVVIGRKLARTLGVEVGGELVVVAQAADGSTANRLYRVRGVLRSVSDGVDRSALLLGGNAFRQLMGLPEGVQLIVARRLATGEPLQQAGQRLTALLPGLEIRDWRQLQPVLARLLDLTDVSLVIMLLITYVAVAILTLNAMLMSVFERIPEFGVMKALGLSPGALFGLIACESLAQVSIAALLAVAGGLPPALYCTTHPLDLSGLVSTSSTIAGIAIEAKWYCVVTPMSVITPLAVLYLMAGLAILYPAAKAALIRPVAAIHHR